MRYCLYILFFLGLFSIAQNIYALDSIDTFETRILKIYNKNILILNRGLEDGIFKNDHIKLTASNGFIARGLCLKASMLSSHWKIYRVVKPELISKDTLYTLNSINQSKKPLFIKNYENVDFSKFTKDIGKIKKKKQIKLQQDRIAKYDLPQSTKHIKRVDPKPASKLDNFIDKNFSNEKLKKDLSMFHFSLFASPMTYQTRYEQKEVNYGASLYNTGSKYLFKLYFGKRERKLVDPVTEEEYSSTKTNYGFEFQLNKLKSYLSLFSQINYNQERIGSTSFPEDQYRIGVLGLKLHLWDNPKTGSFFDVSYLPSFESSTYSNSAVTDFTEREGLRQIIQINAKINMDKRTSVQLNYLSAPFTLMSSTDLEYEDLYQKTEFTLSYKLSDSFYWDYMIEQEVDPLREYLYEVDQNNLTQSFRIRLETDL